MKTLFRIAVMAAVLVFAACSKTPETSNNNDPQQPDPREAFVGDYNLTVEGDVNAVISVPLLSINKEGTYPVNYSDARLHIEKMPSHQDSVIVQITVDNETQETHGEVVGSKILLQPSKMRVKIADIIDNVDLGLSETVLETVKPLVQNAELELRLYHSPATLKDNTLTFTTDVQAEIAVSGFSFNLDGTLNDTAIK